MPDAPEPLAALRGALHEDDVDRSTLSGRSMVKLAKRNAAYRRALQAALEEIDSARKVPADRSTGALECYAAGCSDTRDAIESALARGFAGEARYATEATG